MFNEQVINLTEQKKKTNRQRTSNYWEPIYKPEADNAFEYWQVKQHKLNDTTGKKNVWIKIDDFQDSIYRVEDFTFENVDFEGTLNKRLKFLRCKFINCSFRYTTWTHVKFNDCLFSRVSFTISKFNYCEFRDCKYEKIGLSGNETQFKDVFIEPDKFVKAAYTNTNENVLKENGTSVKYQKYRLEYSKSKFARMLLRMKPIRADIDSYSKAKMTARITENIFYIKKYYHDFTINTYVFKILPLLRFILSIIELVVTYLFGIASGWGLKFSRMFIVGLFLTLYFGIYYKLIFFYNQSFIECYLRSLEYWFFVGYTKYPFGKTLSDHQIIVFINSLLGIFWYSILIPVILEKLGKSDE